MFTGAIPQHPVQTTDQSFTALGLSAEIIATIEKIGFVHPTPIQAAVIPIALTGRDVIGLAQTGSGKTAAFVLPMAEKLVHGQGVRGLILSPTRDVLRRLPRERHTMMFSATMPDSIEMIARDFMRSPERIDIMPAGGAAE